MASNQLAEAPFDPQARYVDKETGVEYEDFGSWVAGTPKEGWRNATLSNLVAAKVPKAVRNRWWRAYDVAHFVHSDEDFDDTRDSHFRRAAFARSASGLRDHEEQEQKVKAESEYEQLKAQIAVHKQDIASRHDRLKYDFLTGSKFDDEDLLRKLAGVGVGVDRVVTGPNGDKYAIAEPPPKRGPLFGKLKFGL